MSNDTLTVSEAEHLNLIRQTATNTAEIGTLKVDLGTIQQQIERQNALLQRIFVVMTGAALTLIAGLILLVVKGL